MLLTLGFFLFVCLFIFPAAETMLMRFNKIGNKKSFFGRLVYYIICVPHNSLVPSSDLFLHEFVLWMDICEGVYL